MNTVGIKEPCVMIANNEVLFEQYRIDHKQDKDAINIEGEDAINRNQFFLISC